MHCGHLSTLRQAIRLRAASSQAVVSQTVTSTLETMGNLFEDWGPQNISDQTGKTFVITGSNAGLGYEAAKELARKGGHVIMATRNPEKAQG